MVHPYGLLSLVLLVHIPVTAASTSFLTPELLSVLSQPALSNLPDTANLLQNVNNHTARIEQILAAHRQGDQNSAGVLEACQIGRLVLGDRGFLDSSSTVYVNATDDNWSETSWLPARCIFKPFSNAGVAICFKIAVFLDTKFAVRSGGHNPNPGYGSINGSGLLIDLANLKELKIDSNHRTVKVAPGNRWIDVYSYLDPYHLSAIGTKEPGPGVGGSVLGGGDPFFPAQYGFACDNVEDFEIILGNSSLVHANINENPNLFVALKGGGPNFGIVTAYTLYTRPLYETWYHVVTFSNESNAALFAALYQFQQAAEHDPKANIVFTLSGNTTVVGFLYADHVARPGPFSGFTNITTSATLIPPTNGTIKELCIAIGSLDSPISAKRAISALSTSVDRDLYSRINEQYQYLAATVPFGTSLALSIQTVTQSTVNKSNSYGANALGIAAQPQIWFATFMQWTSDADTSTSEQVVSKLNSAMATVAGKQNLLLPFLYQNDAGYFQNPLLGIGASRLAEMKITSNMYDPSQIFQRLQNDGFLLSR